MYMEGYEYFFAILGCRKGHSPLRLCLDAYPIPVGNSTRHLASPSPTVLEVAGSESCCLALKFQQCQLAQVEGSRESVQGQGLDIPSAVSPVLLCLPLLLRELGLLNTKH